MAAVLFYIFQTKTKFLFQSLCKQTATAYIFLCILWWCLYSFEPHSKQWMLLIKYIPVQSRIAQCLMMYLLGHTWGIASVPEALPLSEVDNCFKMHTLGHCYFLLHWLWMYSTSAGKWEELVQQKAAVRADSISCTELIPKDFCQTFEAHLKTSFSAGCS